MGPLYLKSLLKLTNFLGNSLLILTRLLILKRYIFVFLLIFQKPFIAISLVGIGVTFLDFSADSCDSPLRAYLLDVCCTKDQDTGLNIHAFLGGVGASFGYVLAALVHNEQTLYFIAASIFIVCLISTMTAAHEKRYRAKAKKIDGLTITNFLHLFKKYHAYKYCWHMLGVHVG